MAKKQKTPAGKDPVATVERGNISLGIFLITNTVKGKAYAQYEFTYYPHVGAPRVRRRFAKLAKAKAEAELVATKLANGQHEVLQLNSLDRACYLQCRELVQPLGRSLFSVVTEYVESIKLLPEGASLREVAAEHARRNGGVRENRMIPTLVTEYIAAKEKAGRSDAHLRDLRLRLVRFGKTFSIRVDRITGKDLQTWLDAMDASNRSKLNELRHVASLLRFAVKRKYAGRELLEELEGIERPVVIPTPTLIFTPAELHELFVAAKSAFVPWLTIGAFCGLRSAEILRLDWREVNLQRRMVEVKAGNAKTAQRRIVPLCDAAVEWLTPYAKSEGRVACHINDNWFYRNMAAAVNQARKQAGVKAKFSWKRNGLRHSYASYRLALTHDVGKVALECGNSAAMIFKHYRELCMEDEAKRWFETKPPQADKVVVLPHANAVGL